jgi:hypothetical protein
MLHHEVIDEQLSSCGKGPGSRCYGRTAALRLIVQSCDEDDEFLILVMEHRWNEIDRGKTEVLGGGKNFFYHKSR